MLPVVLILGGVGAVGLVAVAVVAGAWFFGFRQAAPPNAAAPAVAAPAPPPAMAAADPPGRPDPLVVAKPAAPPAGDVVQRVKRSTVYIRCSFGPGETASGTGFVAGQPGYVVTNAHVIGYGPRVLRPADKVEVVVHSGEPGERVLTATVYGVDADADLALLRLPVADFAFPDPLPFGSSAGLRETEEVVIYGFPFGEMLGQNISVNKTTVSSLRREGGGLAMVQLAGGMNPGNSGGPVTNAAGQVVGVCVAGLRGAQGINFAIPAEAGARFVDAQFRTGGRVDTGKLVRLPDRPPAAVGGVPPRPDRRPPDRLQPPGSLPPPSSPPPFAPAAYTPPPGAAGPEAVLLAGPVDMTVVGGNGRYLIFRLAGKRVLAVFDVGRRQVVKEVPTADEGAVYAAGLTHLFVLSPGQRKIVRWNLTTLEKEDPIEWPAEVDTGDVQHACMGRASAGPLFIHQGRKKETVCLVPETGKATPIGWMHWSRSNAYGPAVMHAFPDGSGLVGWGGGWAGCDVAAVADGVAGTVRPKIEFSGGDDRETALPTADGRLVLTNWAIVNRRFEAVKVPGDPAHPVPIPAMEPGFFLTVTGPRGSPINGFGNGFQAPDLVVYAEDRGRLFGLGALPELKTDDKLYWYKRVFYYPSAGLLVTLGEKRDRLLLRRVDLRERLKASPDDYLVVVSRPPPARRGAAFEYKPDVASSAGGVKARLVSGPPGLTVAADGTIRWTVPAGPAARAAEVTVELTDAKGREGTYGFLLSPEG